MRRVRAGWGRKRGAETEAGAEEGVGAEAEAGAEAGGTKTIATQT